jgi:fumarate reductase subunit D
MLFIETSTEPPRENHQEEPDKEGVKGMQGDKDIEENKAIAVLSYLGILCLVPLLLKKDSKFSKFHAKQGLVLTIGWFFVWIPFMGQIIWALLAIFSLWGIINVLNGKYVALPIIGDLAEKINI